MRLNAFRVLATDELSSQLSTVATICLPHSLQLYMRSLNPTSTV